jgi:hypothetical protein
MSLNLPDHIRLPTSLGKHNLAIAQIAILPVLSAKLAIVAAKEEAEKYRSMSSQRNAESN